MSDEQAFRGDVDHTSELDRLRAENALLKPGVIRRRRAPKNKPTFPYRLKGDTTEKRWPPQSAYSKSGRWTEPGGLHKEFVSPFPEDQLAFWRRFWRELGLEE